MFDYNSRIEKLQNKLKEKQVDAVLLAGMEGVNPNIYYYTGDTAFPTLALITQTDSIMWSTFEPHEVPAQSAYTKVNGFKNYRKEIKNELEKLKTLGLDAQSDITAGLLLKEEKKNYSPVNLTKELLSFRETKDKQEIKLIKQAQDVTKKAIHKVLDEDVNGLTEMQVAGKFEYNVRELGGTPDSFPIIVQYGKASAVFHASTTNQKINLKTAPLLLDCGAKSQFYCGDYSTTVYEGKDEVVLKAMQAVKESQAKAYAYAKVGDSGKKMTQKAIDVLREFGYKDHTFSDVGLALGHHVGLQVHDGYRSLQDIQKFETGMTFTNEPGLYFPGKFGVRFEDLAIL